MQPSDPHSCGICGRLQHEGVSYRPDGQYGLIAHCPQCGTYRLSHLGIPASYSWSPELRRALSCAARQASEAGQPLEIDETNAAELADGHANTRAADNIGRLLLLIATRSERPGGSAILDKSTDFTLIDCHSRKEFDQYFAWITQTGLATWEPVPTSLGPTGTPITGPTIAASLTMGLESGSTAFSTRRYTGAVFCGYVVRSVHE